MEDHRIRKRTTSLRSESAFRKRRWPGLALTLLILAGLMAAACPRNPESPATDKVALQLKWFHQAQFAGFYVAKENGLYAAEHLDVEFLPGGKGVDLIDAVVSGRADFAVVAPEDLLVRRSRGAPLTAIAAIYRRSAVVYVARAGSGIERPFDFMGKSVAVGGSAADIRDMKIQFDALMKALGLDDTRIRRVPYDPTYQSFLRGEVDVTPAYFTGGVVRINKTGQATDIIWPGDYGIRFYSDILVAGDRILSSRPEVVVRFLRASLKGWQAAVGDTAMAVDATLKYAKLPDREIQTAMMEAQMPLVHTGEDHIGWMKREDWQGMIRVLAEQGVLSAPLPRIEDVFTMRFLNAVYAQERQK